MPRLGLQKDKLKVLKEKKVIAEIAQNNSISSSSLEPIEKDK